MAVFNAALAYAAELECALRSTESRGHAAGKAEGERIGEAKGLRRAADILSHTLPGQLGRAELDLKAMAAELEGKEGT